MDYYDEVVEIKQNQNKVEDTGIKETAINDGGEGVSEISGPKKLAEIDNIERTTQKRPTSSLPRKTGQKVDRISSDTESSGTDTEENLKISAEGFDYKQWENLNLSSELKEMYQYIAR